MLSGIPFSDTNMSYEARAADPPTHTIRNKEVVNSVHIPLKRPGSTNNTSWDRDFLQESNAVVAEVFTATWCPPCADADEALEELLDEEEYYSRKRFNALFYHPYPDSRDEDPFGFPEGQARIDELYGFDSFPSVAFDGIREDVGAGEDVLDRYVNHIQTLLSRKGIVALEGSISVEDRDVELTVTIKPTSDVHPVNLDLLVVLVEDHLYFEGSNGVTDHRNVLRDVLKKEEFQLTEEPHDFSHGFTVNGNWNMSNCSLVVFAQSTEHQFFGGETGNQEPADEDDGAFLPYLGFGIAVLAGALLAYLLVSRHQDRKLFMDEILKEREKRKQATAHTCELCDRGFASKDALKRHTRDEHFTSCPACGVKLKESNLAEHLKKVHK